MSEPRSIAAFPAAAPPTVRAAIARAAERTGVDFDYLLAQAKIESSLDPAARARTSSAAGLYQFTNATWRETLERHGDEHGLGWARAALADPATRSAAMALRHDPAAASLMAAELASDNRAALTGVLGREPDAAELYLAHFLGVGGASKFLGALQADPGQSAAALLPQAAPANRTIFYGEGGAPRSLGGVMALMRGKVDRAMGETGGFEAALAAAPLAAANAPQVQGGPVAREFAGMAADQHSGAPPRASMAQTLADTFALSGGHGEAPHFVRAAYGQLKAFGL